MPTQDNFHIKQLHNASVVVLQLNFHIKQLNKMQMRLSPNSKCPSDTNSSRPHGAQPQHVVRVKGVVRVLGLMEASAMAALGLMEASAMAALGFMQSSATAALGFMQLARHTTPTMPLL